MSKPISPIGPISPTWQDRVRTCEGHFGRISFVWPGRNGRTYYRVSFPVGSPFIDDWAVYRQHEVTLATALDADPAAKKSIVDSMRPKIPKS